MFDDVTSPPRSALQFAQGDTADVLVRLSTLADLLVIGTREPLSRAFYATGFINHYCISQASCPVVTVPEEGADSVVDRSSPLTAHQASALAATR